MLRIYICIVLALFLGCSEKTKDEGQKTFPAQKLKFRHKTYSKTDVLLAMKYQLSESVIKEVSRRIPQEFIVDRSELERTGTIQEHVDTNYALTVRATIEAMSREYKIPQQIIASILIDREILGKSSLWENLPDDVAQ